MWIIKLIILVGYLAFSIWFMFFYKGVPNDWIIVVWLFMSVAIGSFLLSEKE